MLRTRLCKIGPTVIIAVLLSLVNTLLLFVFLGPLNFKTDDGSSLQTNAAPFGKDIGGKSQNKNGEIQQVSVVNSYGSFKAKTNVNDRNKGPEKISVFTDWRSQLDISKHQEDNLDHAIDKLKFNRNVMSMAGRSPNTPVDIVIGIPTVKRVTTDYLSSTLRHLVDYMNADDTKQCHIVVFTADFEQAQNDDTADFVKKEFAAELANGLIEVIKPDRSFYPKLDDLPSLWKDKPDRVKWRSKQCIDYALLFAYCRNLGRYYLQLEDDVSVSLNYFREIKNFIRERATSRWSNLQFGTSGFIGMMFKSSDLGRLALFVKMYFWIFPVDILFRHFNDIHLYGNNPSDIYRPPLFRHLGRESSLKGQTRKIEGGIQTSKALRANKRRYTDSTNPNAFISTNIQVFESNTIDGPYKTTNPGYFWGKAVKLNDFVVLKFLTELTLLRVVVESGSELLPNDLMAEGKLETAGTSASGNCDQQGYKFLSSTVSNGKLDTGSVLLPKVKCLKLTITKLNLDDKGNSRWLLIREIAVWSR